MKDILFWIFFIGGILLGVYVGGWVLFIKPIIDVCTAFDAGTLTGSMIGWTIFKCLFVAPVASSAIVSIGAAIGESFGDLL